jgi:hypothetical protein
MAGIYFSFIFVKTCLDESSSASQVGLTPQRHLATRIQFWGYRCKHPQQWPSVAAVLVLWLGLVELLTSG